IDGVLQLEDLTLHVHGDLLGQVTGRHGLRYVGDIAHLAGQVAGHAVDAVGEVLPGAGDAFHVGGTAQCAVGADFAGHPRHFRGERAKLVHHGVDNVLDLKDLAAHVHGDLLRQVAHGDGRGHLRHVAELHGQVAAHAVDAIGEVLPGTSDAFH